MRSSARVRAVGEAEHAQGAGGELRGRGEHGGAVFFRHRPHAAVEDAVAAAQQHVCAALYIVEPPFVRLRRDGHALALGGERDAAQHAAMRPRAPAPRVGGEGDFGRVAGRLPPARAHAVAQQHAREQVPLARRMFPCRALAAARFGQNLAGGGRLRPRRRAERREICDDCFHRHAILGEGARLVRADMAAAAQRLHRVQAADDGALAAHLLHAHRHDDGDDGGHALGDGGDGDRDGGQKSAEQRHAPPEHADAEEQRRDRADKGGDDAAEHGERLFERRFGGLRLGEHARDVANLGVFARRDDDRLRPPAHGEGGGIQHTASLGEGRLGGNGRFRFGDAARLARQRRFVAAQLLGAQDAAVGGGHVAFFQKDDVAGHEQAAVEQDVAAAAHDLGAADGEAVQLFDGGVRAVLLDEADHGVEQHDEQQDARVRQPASIPRGEGDGGGEGGGAQQEDGHKVLELPQKQAEGAALFAGGQGVFSVLLQAAGGLRLADSHLGCLQGGQHLRRGKGVICAHTHLDKKCTRYCILAGRQIERAGTRTAAARRRAARMGLDIQR